MPLDIQISALVITGFVNFGLGLLIYSRARKDISNVLFFLITICITSWSIGMFLWRITDSPLLEYIFSLAIYLSAAFIASSFVLFALSFLSFRSFTQIPKGARYGVFAITFIIILLIVWPDALLQGTYRPAGEVYKTINFGSGYGLYALYIILFFAYGIAVLFRKLRNAKDIQKIQLRYVLSGIAMSVVGATTTNLFLPWAGIFQFFWLGPPLTIFMVVLMTYSIVRHHLLNVRVVATELFTTLILIVILTSVILSKSLSELVTQLAIFVAVLVFGILLIRGTLREIKELERLSRAKSEFVSIASHQLRTPLTAIKGFMSMIKEGSGTEENRKDWLNKIGISNERLVRLVDDLLNISRIERGTIQYNFADADFVQLIEDIVADFQFQAKTKNLSLAWEKPGEDVPKLRIDSDKMIQVVTNLIDNALKYTEKGSVVVRIIYLRDLKKVRLVVQDTGIGIPKEDIPNIFELFSRGQGAQKTSSEGVGIGLYVARKVVETHHGKIWVESEGLHKGSRFYVELPIA